VKAVPDQTFCEVCGQPIYDEENKRLRALLEACKELIADNTFEGHATHEMVGRIETELKR
jgi:predicted nucleic acid-binding Zn ribbon protein